MFHKVGFVATKIQSFFLFSAKMSNYLTPPIAIGYKSCCGNFSRRYWAYRRHRCRWCGVREDILLIQVVFTKKGADEANRNRRWCRWLLPTKEKPLSYVGWAQDKGFMEKGGLGEIPLQRSFIVFVCFYILLISSSSCFLQIKAPPTEKINVKINTASA